MSFETFEFTEKIENPAGADFAAIICARCGANDVYEIARNFAVTIVDERWQPATFGEYHRKTRRIVVNANAPETREKIVAHELGHFFWQEFVAKKSKIITNFDEEKFCDEFAASLLAELAG